MLRGNGAHAFHSDTIKKIRGWKTQKLRLKIQGFRNIWNALRANLERSDMPTLAVVTPSFRWSTFCRHRCREKAGVVASSSEVEMIPPPAFGPFRKLCTLKINPADVVCHCILQKEGKIKGILKTKSSWKMKVDNSFSKMDTLKQTFAPLLFMQQSTVDWSASMKS